MKHAQERRRGFTDMVWPPVVLIGVSLLSLGWMVIAW